MKRVRAINILAILGVALLMVSYLLLSPPKDTPYQILVKRAFWGITCSIAGGLLILTWLWRR